MNESVSFHVTVFSTANCPRLAPSKAEELVAELEKAGVGAGSLVLPASHSKRADELSEVGQEILTAEADLILFASGAGTRAFLDQLSKQFPQQRLLDCISDMATIASPVASEVLQEFGVQAKIMYGSEHPDVLPDWRDLLVCVDQNFSVANQRVAVEFAPYWPGLKGGLESRGASVVEFVPFDLGPSSNSPENFEVADVMVRMDEILAKVTQHVFIFGSAQSAWRFFQTLGATNHQQFRKIRHWFDRALIGAVGKDTKEILQAYGLTEDWCSDDTSTVNLPEFAETVARCNSHYHHKKQRISMSLSGPTSSSSDQFAPWYSSPFMKACRGEATDVTPIWMMRQAGRYMAEYRVVREKVSFLELCANPQLCSEVMCTAVNRLGVDAAIIFSDLLPILVPMGCDLEFVKGDGPVIHNPIKESGDVDRIKPLENNDELSFVMETVRQTRNDLPADMPLIGFAGAPFTLASYMIEGGASRNYADTKKLMFGDPGAWAELMERLVSSISIYLQGQIESGAQCVQLFDSWAGCLSYDDYRTSVLPYVDRIIRNLPPDVPVINFATGNPSLLPLLAKTPASVIGVDWRVRLDDAWQQVGFDRSVQGNLDPTVLLASPKEIRSHAKAVLDQAAGRPGHIFNLGHGILPMTPVDNAIALVDAVHELSQK